MIVLEFVLLLFVFAAAFFVVVRFLHTAFTTLLALVLPEASIHEPIHAIMEMHGSPYGGAEVNQ